MALYVTGDIHGPIDIGKLSRRSWPEGKGLSRSDLVIVCGDFGMPWDGSNEEKYWLSWLNDRSWTTLFVDDKAANVAVARELGMGGEVFAGAERLRRVLPLSAR